MFQALIAFDPFSRRANSSNILTNPELDLYGSVVRIISPKTGRVGVILLALGLGTRIISIPLMITMIVADITVHMGNGFDAGERIGENQYGLSVLQEV